MTDNQVFYDGPLVKRAEAKRKGDVHYFTGKPCSHGHVDVRFVSTYGCRKCTDDHKKRYRSDPEFRERELEYKRDYYLKNIVACSEYRYKYWRTSTKVKEINRASKVKRKDEISKYNSEYTQRNRETIYARRAERYAENPEIFLQYSRNRRAALMEADGSHTADDVLEIYERQDGKCAEPTCRKDLSEGYHVDHIMPLKLGGSNWPNNLQCLCPSCNCKKSAMHPVDWARKNGRLC